MRMEQMKVHFLVQNLNYSYFEHMVWNYNQGASKTLKTIDAKLHRIKPQRTDSSRETWITNCPAYYIGTCLFRVFSPLAKIRLGVWW